MNTASTIQDSATGNQGLLANRFIRVNNLHDPVTDDIEQAIFEQIEKGELPEIDFAIEFKVVTGVYAIRIVVSNSIVNFLSERAVKDLHHSNLEANSVSLYNTEGRDLRDKLRDIGYGVCKSKLTPDQKFSLDAGLSNSLINKSISSIINK